MNTVLSNHPKFEPIAHPDSIVRQESVRFTVLTSRLIRLEYQATGQFEDRPSLAFWYRRQPVPVFRTVQSATQVEIVTDHLHLRYRPHPAGFRPDTLSIELKASDETWHFGDENTGNLGGTVRTVDDVSGNVPLEQGLMSRQGWSVIDDSRKPVLNPDGWPEARQTGTDLYFFGYAHDYLGCLSDFCKLAGKMPLIPRWALGNWWSRYWEYNQQDLLELMADFEAHEIPLSVCVIDMDWHITQTGNSSRGWTGYTWNPEFFPDPAAFLSHLHQMGLKTSLNLHPADGIHPHETVYEEFARWMDVDPTSNEPVQFAIDNPRFAEAYLKLLHHPLEKQGIDFWWIDWQQGTQTSTPGLDPLSWLNHLHFYDLARDGQKRPFIFSRWGGYGNHRYPIGFSGDTHVTWESLAFQPYFTSTAANVGYGWWSHDIGGHTKGTEEPELYARWVQYGVFSPIFRLHSVKTPFYDRRPWTFDAETYRIARQAMQLRHALIPYLYTMARQTFRDDIPLVLPMYHLHSQEETAYHCPNQYYFGSELIAAPHVSALGETTRLSRQVVWLPAGEWFNFFDGAYYKGDNWYAVYGSSHDIPVFAKAGAIVPLSRNTNSHGVENPAELDIAVFPGADNLFKLYEDDGESIAFQDRQYALTPIRQVNHQNGLSIRIGPVEGDTSFVPTERVYHVMLRGMQPPQDIQWFINGEQMASPDYDVAGRTLHFEGITLKPTDICEIQLVIETDSGDHRVDDCWQMLEAFRMPTYGKHELAEALPDILQDITRLADFLHFLDDAQRQALIEILVGSGVYRIDHTGEDERMILWNNQSHPAMQYTLSWKNEYLRYPPAEKGLIPRFKMLKPGARFGWCLRVNYAGLSSTEFLYR